MLKRPRGRVGSGGSRGYEEQNGRRSMSSCHDELNILFRSTCMDMLDPQSMYIPLSPLSKRL